MNKYEELVQLYLRLNGFFTVTNFVLHPRSVRTDVDVFGVRFPFERESLWGEVLENDQTLALSGAKIDVILAEVRKEKLHLNTTWSNERAENRMRYALEFLGFFSSSSPQLAEAARALASSRTFEDPNIAIRVMLFSGHPRVRHGPLDRRLDGVLNFITWRFKKYAPLKRYHPMWASLAEQLFQFVTTSSEPLTLDVFERLSPDD